MSKTSLTDDASVRELAETLREAGRSGAFALDLEFVSESRYVPEICLAQVALGRPGGPPRWRRVDPLAADATPVLELVADPEVEMVFHAAQADLALLGQRFGTSPGGTSTTPRSPPPSSASGTRSATPSWSSRSWT